MRRCFLPLCLLFAYTLSATPVAAQSDLVEWPEEIESALERAGDNRDEIESALTELEGKHRRGMMFLVENMPERDLTTLTGEYLVENVTLAYSSFESTRWSEEVPEEVFLNYVLPYANINENRDDWRKEFIEKFASLVEDAESPGQAAAILNQNIFQILNVRYSTGRNRADQGPFESIDTGLASCTGLSILLIDACRAVGVPARFVGTPLWSDGSGNHSWVEVWDQGWHFTGAAEPTGDELNRAWFIGRASSADRDNEMNAIYAVSFRKTPQHFPMVWNRSARYISAVNVTDRYTQSEEPLPEGMVRVRFVVRESADGDRIVASIRLLDQEGEEVFSGTTRDERFDMNDHLTARLSVDERYQMLVSSEDQVMRFRLTAENDEQLIPIALDQFELDDLSNLEAVEGDDNNQELIRAINEYFEKSTDDRDRFESNAEWDEKLRDDPDAVRQIVWDAYRASFESTKFREDFDANQVTWNDYVSPYVVRTVGERPETGWPLFIAMHGGGGVPAEINDQQWQVMQRYYRDQESVTGYLYLALRAPTNEWNGFYTTYNLPLMDRLIKQFTIAGDIDPNRVFLMGYSHGGYGAFYVGRVMADRFAAVHASAAAPSIGNEVGRNLRNTRFTFMIGEHDTRYERLTRCQSFGEFMDSVKAEVESNSDYPVVMEYKEGFGHGGLPDRDKIAEMYAFERQTFPRHLTWIPASGADPTFSWIDIDQVESNQRIDAQLDDNRLELDLTNVASLSIFLNEDMVDLSQPLVVSGINDEAVSIVLEPSVAIVCESMIRHGDPTSLFSVKLSLESQTE